MHRIKHPKISILIQSMQVQLWEKKLFTRLFIISIISKITKTEIQPHYIQSSFTTLLRLRPMLLKFMTWMSTFDHMGWKSMKNHFGSIFPITRILVMEYILVQNYFMEGRPGIFQDFCFSTFEANFPNNGSESFYYTRY